MQVREYSILTTDNLNEPSLDVGHVSQATFDWLVDLTQQWKDSERLLIIENKRVLKLGSYVGYLQSPTGESIEIIPKTRLGEQDPVKARNILHSMLRSVLKLPAREYGQANLMRMDTPIHEWIFSQFLSELKILVSKGLRFSYQRIEEESYFIRGQLDINKQQRQPPGKAHFFHIRHDIFSPNRIENKLIKTTLLYVQCLCKHPENWRLTNELSHQLAIIDVVQHPLEKIEQWRNTKFTRSYEDIRPWCQLILEKLNPNFQKGKHRGIALLFPMQRLFEEHVATCLKSSLCNDWKLTTQAASEFLISHKPEGIEQQKNWFQLKPDLLLNKGLIKQVMDSKWKLLDENANTSEFKYDVKQSDLYQLFTYGKKYQNGQGHMMLIYPKHDGFQRTLPPFYFSEELTLWLVPFCLETKMLIEGDWAQFFPALIKTNNNNLLRVI